MSDTQTVEEIISRTANRCYHTEYANLDDIRSIITEGFESLLSQLAEARKDATTWENVAMAHSIDIEKVSKLIGFSGPFPPGALSDAIQTKLSQAERDRDELRKVVDQIPETRDGKKLVNGMTVYIVKMEMGERRIRPQTAMLCGVHEDNDSIVPLFFADCYSTREAALAAKQPHPLTEQSKEAKKTEVTP
jgi:tRNA-binding EMAP/Myf-like protein